MVVGKKNEKSKIATLQGMRNKDEQNNRIIEYFPFALKHRTTIDEPLCNNLGAKSATSNGYLLKQDTKSFLLILPSPSTSNKLKSPSICNTS
ncbi:hypothetical protein CDL12_11098 [Handroanthus impetiginosus]|uniref:Uncharacterized protein n=1 Tax=Handroanthus impetiginosus TaxID=429701 RepID=A0A2G9HFC2_9LAMI|nr:hypothetical protein CDL12_11098 [Handroanthus impetiginosus]